MKKPVPAGTGFGREGYSSRELEELERRPFDLLAPRFPPRREFEEEELERRELPLPLPRREPDEFLGIA
jgi:hypothetical protein